MHTTWSLNENTINTSCFFINFGSQYCISFGNHSPIVSIMWTCDMQPSVLLQLHLSNGICFLPVATKTMTSMTFINFAANVKIKSKCSLWQLLLIVFFSSSSTSVYCLIQHMINKQGKKLNDKKYI